MLPKIDHPVYPIYIKSLDRKVKFRPFLVKEEKVLLMAKESEEEAVITDAVTQIITNCALEPIDVATLPMFDIEMIFLMLRAKSVGEKVKLTFTCKNEVNGSECGAETAYQLNLEKIEYQIPEGHDAKVMLTDTIGIKLKYPTIATSSKLLESEDEYVSFLAGLMANIEYVFDAESVYKVADSSVDELTEWLGDLSLTAIEQIKNFYSTSPKVVLEDKVTCKACGFEHTIRSENLLDFFI
jgi:T4 bacteriophage base plate protein